jgi:hypothetical protein
LYKYLRAGVDDAKAFWALWVAVIGKEFPGNIDCATVIVAMMTLIVATYERRLFVTEKGYIGNRPPRTQLGDKVFVLQGSVHWYFEKMRHHRLYRTAPWKLLCTIALLVTVIFMGS